jgi:hypothetical protein
LREPADIDQLALAGQLVERCEKVDGIMGKAIRRFVGAPSKREYNFLLSQSGQALGKIRPAGHGFASRGYIVEIDPGRKLAWNELETSR